MTIRNLDHLFRPRSVAAIGASSRERTVGRTLIDNLLGGGFEGPIFPVNPKHRSIGGVMAYPDVESLPEAPDLAVIATPRATVPELVDRLGRRGTRAAIVITAGFGEGQDDAGDRLRQAVLDAARPHLLRVVGPNCVGVLVPGAGLNASFAHRAALAGDIAFVTQSGAMATSVIDWAAARGIGFSHLVSLGDMSDVDFGDVLDYLTHDAGTRAILLYVEAITHARKFMSAARAASRIKPVIVVKAGRSAEGARAASSHSGALAGTDAVYDAAFRRAGMLRVPSMEALFSAVETLASNRLPAGDRLAILSNGGGVGVLATDALIAGGGQLAELGTDVVGRLDEVLPPTWSRANPVDIIGDAPPERYAAALEILLRDVSCDGVLVLNCPTAITPGLDAARAVTEVAGRRALPQRSVLTCWLGEDTARIARDHFAEHRLPTYDTPELAVRAFLQMAAYRRNQDLLMETPPAVTEELAPDVDRARAIVEDAIGTGRDWLTEIEAKRVLDAYRIPTVPTAFVESPEAAARYAERLGSPAALKIVSPDVVHKSDIGGVALDLATPVAVREAAEGMLRRIGQRHHAIRLDGFSIQPMVRRPRAFELIAGISTDPLFGPVLLFGQGGTAVEILDDKAIALPPLNLALVRELIARTRISRLLRGYRDHGPVDMGALEMVLLKLSQLVIDLDGIAELDINPLLADEFGVVALDARIRVARPEREGQQRLAIRPYPSALEETTSLPGGEGIFLRPIRPEDEPALQAAFRRLSPKDVRMRFFAPLKRLTHEMAARLTQIDYDREMAFVALRRGGPEDGEAVGVGRLYADPDGERAEYSIAVMSDFQGHGLGHLLMTRLIRHARERGITEIFGSVLSENGAMLRLCDEFGFERQAAPGESGIIDVRLDLAGRTDQAASVSSA